MTHSFMILLQDSFMLTAIMSLFASFAVVGSVLSGTDAEDASEGELDDDSQFQFSAAALRQYQEMVAETDARIAELADQLDDDSCTDRREALEELAQCYLQNAARAQEEGESERASDYYAAAFARYEECLNEFGEERETLRHYAAGQLNYAILLNDDGDLEDADEAYLAAQETTQKLVDMGDHEASLDRAGIKLNRASIAFELNQRSRSFDMLDETAEEFQALVAGQMSQSPEAYYYLAKTYMTKASFLSSTSPDVDASSPNVVEACELASKAVEIFRTLVNAGHTQYRRELADALVIVVELSPQSEKTQLDAALALLDEAKREYEACVAIGESEACPDLFTAVMERAELLERLGRAADAAAEYDFVVDAFASFADSNDLPAVEGLARAFQRRAMLRKSPKTRKSLLSDLDHAIHLHLQVADSLIYSLSDAESDGGCGCGHDDCDHPHEHSHDGCGHCGACESDGCSCGAEHGHSCGCGCGGCSEHERRFLIDRWVSENYRDLMDAYYECVTAHMEDGNMQRAQNVCLAAMRLHAAYHKVLCADEALDAESYKLIRQLADSFVV